MWGVIERSVDGSTMMEPTALWLSDADAGII